MPKFDSFAQFEIWLNQKGLFHIDLSLDRMFAALARLNLPVNNLLAVQVLGTNGKGSTSSFLAALAVEHGLKTGLNISPHFISIRERILLNGQQLAPGEWLEAANWLHDQVSDLDLTYFEFVTLLARVFFANAGVELAVFEAGLGGAHDATTALACEMHCFTPIALDHLNILGKSLEEIAADKAKAIGYGSSVFTGPQFPQAKAQLAGECAMKKAKLEYVDSLPDDITVGMAGPAQRGNAALALACWRKIAAKKGISSQPQLEAQALAKAFMPGRLQIIEQPNHLLKLVLDGGHNPHALQYVSRHAAPDIIIFSALADKNWQVNLSLLSRLGKPIWIPQLTNGRAANAVDLAGYGNKIRPGSCASFASLGQALAALTNYTGTALICGSLYLLAEFYEINPQYLKKAD